MRKLSAVPLIMDADILPTPPAYVTLGTGMVSTEYELFGTELADDAQVFKGGLGLRFGFGSSDRGALRIEAAVATEDTFDIDSTHYIFTVGYSYRFGG